MRIAVDADDTVIDQTAVLLPLMNWKLGTTYKPEDIEWNFFHNKTPDIEKAFWDVHNLYDTMYLRRAMPPTDGFAFPVLKEMQRRGNELEVVTRNRPESTDHIHDWFWMHGVEIRVRAIGRGGGDASVKAKMPYDVFIDDAPALASVMSKHPSKRLIIFSRPWNAGVKTTKNVLRADDWLAVRKILLGLGA